jgi:hypothetical protein
MVELTVVVILGTVILGAVYEVLITNLRAYTVVNARVRSQQTVRAGVGVLFGELRELSPEGGDLLSFDADSMTVRSSSAFGVVCSVTVAATPELTVRPFGAWIQASDSVFVLADNDPESSIDDVWLAAKVGSVDTTASCGGGASAQEITLPGMQAAMVADSVRTGASLRVFAHYSYGLTELDGEWYLGRSSSGGTSEPLVGPLEDGGLLFEYLDSLGVATTTATDVAQFRITLKSAPVGAGPGLQPVSDSLVTRIYARN